jgi:ketosteroid isomerase-like protein
MASTPPGPFERCAPGSADHPILVLSRRARARGSIQAPSPLSAVATSRRGSGSDSSRSKLPLCVSRRLPASGRQISEDRLKAATSRRSSWSVPPAGAPVGAEGRSTADVIRRFNDAFVQRDPDMLIDLVAYDCVMESTKPAPNGTRYEGYDACLRFWQELIDDPNGSFEPEDVVVSGDHATIRWRYRFGEGDENSVRGVTLMHARDRKIVEALGYVKAGLRP